MFVFPSGLKAGDIVEHDGKKYEIDFACSPAGYRFHEVKAEAKTEVREETKDEEPKRRGRPKK